jgi:polar amino acid transport system substrate-binding protein
MGKLARFSAAYETETLSMNKTSGALAAASIAVVAAMALLSPPSSAAGSAASFTGAQAAAGAKTFAAKCAQCHGAKLEGVSAPALKGASLTSTGQNTGELFKFITEQMPAGNPGSLSKPEYVNVMAFLLKENGTPAGSKPLTYASALASHAPVGKK